MIFLGSPWRGGASVWDWDAIRVYLCPAVVSFLIATGAVLVASRRLPGAGGQSQSGFDKRCSNSLLSFEKALADKTFLSLLLIRKYMPSLG